MSDIGPTWLRKELPQPIANAWHLALLGSPVDGFAAATAVEVALRFVTALQVASLLAEGGRRPGMLDGGRFKRPSLGSWIVLARQLRDALHAPFLPELGAWPDPHTDGLLRSFADARNALAHAGQMTPLARREIEQTLATNAAEVLETLSWLRRVALIYVIEMHAEAAGSFSGRAQTFRSWDVQPPSERLNWEGAVELNHLYLATSGAEATNLLDVEPFVQRARLGKSHTDAVCVWAGVGERGDVISSDDLQGERGWARVSDTVRVVHFRRLPTRRAPTDATFHEIPVEEPATAVSFPQVTVPAPEAVTAPAGAGRPWRGRSVGRVTLWLTVALVALGGAAVVWALSRPQPCIFPNLTGAWRFNTGVLDGKAGRERGRAVTGHYTVEFGAPVPECQLPASVVKTGYTYPDKKSGQMKNEPLDLSKRVAFDPSPTGHSVAAYAPLGHLSNISFRISRVGDTLVGLWRHEGEDRKAAGYSGYLVGGLGGAELPQVSSCFVDCLADCHDGADPRDVETEDCLIRCTRRISTCTD
ncbi:MAG: hypothetical protein CVU56_27430 [Deltaproteobacteria bacterium HGW-Deltaproteobacteria-14]|jgi:hypothetical protein|nr:MAG: hypothetical protein CVU56_27430 [Deltaproteobacteria bacterium HGW-Deltaproteobacteria-14]